MNTVRVLLNDHLDALIEAQRAIDFQRMAHQCLRARWPSLAAVPEHADLGEDGITILAEASDGVQRSLLCSLTATIEKLRSDTRKIATRNVRLDEVVFATPRRVTRAQQERWAKWVGSEYGWRLIVIERSEFLAILERPESQWICRDYLGLPLRHSVLLTGAEEAKEAGRVEDCLRLATEAERVGLESEDKEILCRAQILQAEAFLELGNATKYRELADQALRTARDANLSPHLPKCLLLRANAILPDDPREAHRLLAEAEASIDSNDSKSRRWSLLIRARLEEGEDRLDAARSTLTEWHSLVKRGEKTNRQGFHYLSFRIAAKTGDPQALGFLARALREAAAKKQWTFVGDMLREKALFLARRGKLKEAAEQSINASVSYRKAGNKEAELDAAVLSGQMFLEVHLADRALEFANYAIERTDSTSSKKIEENALQLKTRALQSLGRIDEAMAVNNRFRALVTLQPIALVVADAQEAMLYFQKGELGSAAANMEKALHRARETGAQEEIVAAIRIHLAEIKITQTRFREARQLLEDAIPLSEKLPPKVLADLSRMLEFVKSSAPITSEFESFLALPDPLHVAGTSDCRSIQAAHRRILEPLLEWVATWQKQSPILYDFWGRGNFARFVLNHRGFAHAWHVSVEVTTVEEADLWSRVLCPFVDVLTILWKGPITTGLAAMVPVQQDYEGPGGWGYTMAGANDMRPDDDPNDWNWSPAFAEATWLPDDAVRFLFVKARALFEAGRLFLFPAPNVGCPDVHHGPLERMFNTVVNAVPCLSAGGRNLLAQGRGSFPLPFFPDIPLSELARVIAGEEDNLLETRVELCSWAQTLASQGGLEENGLARELHERIESNLRKVARKYEDIARKLSWASDSGQINSYVLRTESLDIEPRNLAAAELVAIHSELRSSPWHAFFRMSSAGYRWDVTSRVSRAAAGRKAPKRPRKVVHWLVPPRAGWTIPVMVTAK